MPQLSRSSRALRGTVAAFFATFVSLISHVLAGGAVPGLFLPLMGISLAVFHVVDLLVAGVQRTRSARK